MKKIILFASLLISLGLSAQRTVRDDNAVTRTAKNFHAIEISDGIDLYLSQGNEEVVAVSASSNEYRDKIHVDVVNGTLKIFYERENNRGWTINWGNRKLKAYVSVKTLDKLYASGGADILIDGELNVDRLAMHISGGSDFKGKVNLKEFTLDASGGSDANISGRADQVKIDASGGSDVNGYELISGTCTIRSSGGSDVHITANKEINANASGGSDIYYKGTASSNTSKSGGGSIKRVN
ncbi:MAG: head GIN domain-containing protein [Sediminibacterium sp.]